MFTDVLYYVVILKYIWDVRWCQSRAWRFVDINDLICCDIYASTLRNWTQELKFCGPRKSRF